MEERTEPSQAPPYEVAGEALLAQKILHLRAKSCLGVCWLWQRPGQAVGFASALVARFNAYNAAHVAEAASGGRSRAFVDI